MKERILSSAVMAFAALFLICNSDHAPFYIALVVIAILALFELGKLTRQPFMVLGLIPAAAICLLPANGRSPETLAPGVLLTWLIGLATTRWLANTKADRPSLAAIMAGGYVVGPLVALATLRHTASDGWQSLLLLTLFPVWTGDTFAYFAGKAIGGKLLAPTISPKKTIAGGIANLLAATAMGAGVAVYCHYDVRLGLACGFVAGSLGQVGDLFESYLKRCAGVKDSGNLIPGHGGVMDRIDSLLFTAPIICLIVALWTTAGLAIVPRGTSTISASDVSHQVK